MNRLAGVHGAWLLAAAIAGGDDAGAAGAGAAASATVVSSSDTGTPGIAEILDRFAPVLPTVTGGGGGVPPRVPVLSGGGAGGSAGGTGGAGGAGTGASVPEAGPSLLDAGSPDGAFSVAVTGSGPSYTVSRTADGQVQVDFN